MITPFRAMLLSGLSAVPLAGYTEAPHAIQYVGGKTFTDNNSANGAGTVYTISLTDLTGGSNSKPQVGDLVIVNYVSGSSGTDQDMTVGSGYTELADLFSSNTASMNAGVYMKLLTAADTSFTFTRRSSNCDAVAVHVWRYVDPVTPLDVATVQEQAANIVGLDPPAITPVTAGAKIIIAAGMGALWNSAYQVTNTDSFLNFIATTVNSSSPTNYSAKVGLMAKNWSGSGAYNSPVIYGGGSSGSGNGNHFSLVMALRPKYPGV